VAFSGSPTAKARCSAPCFARVIPSSESSQYSPTVGRSGADMRANSCMFSKAKRKLRFKGFRCEGIYLRSGATLTPRLRYRLCYSRTLFDYAANQLMRGVRPRRSSCFASDSRFTKVRMRPTACAELRRAPIEVKHHDFSLARETPLAMAGSMPHPCPSVISRIH